MIETVIQTPQATFTTRDGLVSDISDNLRLTMEVETESFDDGQYGGPVVELVRCRRTEVRALPKRLVEVPLFEPGVVRAWLRDGEVLVTREVVNISWQRAVLLAKESIVGKSLEEVRSLICEVRMSPFEVRMSPFEVRFSVDLCDIVKAMSDSGIANYAKILGVNRRKPRLLSTLVPAWLQELNRDPFQQFCRVVPDDEAGAPRLVRAT